MRENSPKLTFILVDWRRLPLLGLRSSTSRVYRVPAHRMRPVHAVQLEVQAARVAHHLPLHVPPPYRRRLSATVRTGEIHPLSHRRRSSLQKIGYFNSRFPCTYLFKVTC